MRQQARFFDETTTTHQQTTNKLYNILLHAGVFRLFLESSYSFVLSSTSCCERERERERSHRFKLTRRSAKLANRKEAHPPKHIVVEGKRDSTNMAFNKLFVMLPVMLAARRIDGENPSNVYWLRVAYGVSQLCCVIVVLYSYVQAQAAAGSIHRTIYVPPKPEVRE